MNKNQSREDLIRNGVKNLREFGYPDCDENNILKHSILKTFFISMLKENKGINKEADKIIDDLLEEMK